jgi:hypothetical protein
MRKRGAEERKDLGFGWVKEQGRNEGKTKHKCPARETKRGREGEG